ncbi:hypothetical protein BDV93DRAFT_126399 [Ceratobasidium sp. AG-I]|nr:hypothetical protein BDV93DRAFT_126399 [Ceratobasidium sp. AG-I]
MAEFLANPDAFHYAPSSSPPSSPIPWDADSPEISDDEQDHSSPWRLTSDPYSANAKATQSPLVHSQNTRRSYALPLTPSSSFPHREPPSPSPAPRSKPLAPRSTSIPNSSTQHSLWEAAIDDAFQTGASIINLDNSNITIIPRTINDLNNMISWPGEPISPLPPFREKDTSIRSNIAAAAARSRRVFSQTQSNSSLFSGTPSKSKRELQLYLANNCLTMLPSELFALRGLTLLSLRSNKLRELPPAIGNLRSLRSLNIANNELTFLPAEITYLALQTILLDPNPFIPRPFTNTNIETPPSSAESDHTVGTLAFEHDRRTLAPLITHNKVPTLQELALRVTLRPAQQIPSLPSLSFATSATRPSAAVASRCLLTPTTSYSSVFSTPTHVSNLSRSSSASSPYESHPFPPHSLLVSDLYDVTSWLSGSLPKADVYIRSAIQGTEDARNLYSWCPGKRHQGEDKGTDAYADGCAGRLPSSGLFVKPAEERYEWVTVLAGCELSSAVPILWRGCSAGCLDFLGGAKDSPVLNKDTRINKEREEDEEFISMFGIGSAKGEVAPSEEEDEEMVEAQTQIVWDDMMDLDD